VYRLACAGVPSCLCAQAGQGKSPAEDGDDMDDQGSLLPSYDYNDFAVLDVSCLCQLRVGDY